MRDMAVNTLIQADTTPRTKVLENGAVYDMETKRIVSGAVLSSDRARDMVRARVERKRAIVQAAAQDAVQRGDLRTKYGGDAWLAEVTQTQMAIATTPEAGKSAVMAAAWLVDNAGMGEKQAQQEEAVQAAQIVGDVVHDLAQLSAVWADVVARQANGFDNSNYHKQAIDVQTSDTAQHDTQHSDMASGSTAAADSGG